MARLESAAAGVYALRVWLPLALGALVSVAAGVVLADATPSRETALVCLVGLALAVPLGYRIARGRFDLFEPLTAISLALAVMYVARPAAVVAAGEPALFKGYDVTGRLDEALAIVFVAVVAFHIGYALPFAHRIAERMRPAPGRWAIDLTVTYAVGVIVIALGLFSVFLMQSGGLHLAVEFLKGRNATYESIFRNSSAYLYGAPALIWPASLLLFAAGIAARRRLLVVLALLAMVPLAVFAGGSGSRITLIPLLLAPAVYWFLSRGRRPSVLAVAIVGYLVFTVGIAYFRDTRTAGADIDRMAELQKAVLNPARELNELIRKGTDNDMFESLAVETVVVPERLPAEPLDYVIRIVAKPIPSKIWKGKPTSPDERLNDVLFPDERVRASSSTGIVGSFYLAGELPGVFVGMLLFGLVFRIPWEYWRRYPATSTAQLVLTMSLMLVPVFLRGALADTIPYLLFSLAPLLVAVRLCRVPAGEEPQR